jgi:hypothetical protein
LGRRLWDFWFGFAGMMRPRRPYAAYVHHRH